LTFPRPFVIWPIGGNPMQHRELGFEPFERYGSSHRLPLTVSASRTGAWFPEQSWWSRRNVAPIGDSHTRSCSAECALPWCPERRLTTS